MKSNAKRAIFLRIFTGFIAVYLVLMAGFSVFLIARQNNIERLEFHGKALQLKGTIERSLNNYLDTEKHIADKEKFRRELDISSHSLAYGGLEFAVYTGGYDLIYHTNDYWVCEFVEHTEITKKGTKRYIGRAYLNPKAWFSDKEIAELEYYLSKDISFGEVKVKQLGALAGYLIHIDGFWLDQDMIIPNKIVVTPAYAAGFDEKGNVNSAKGKEEEQIVYVANSKAPEGLPYFERGTINSFIYMHKSKLNKERQALLRNRVLDQEMLKQHIKHLELNQVLSERVNLLTYRYYMVLPYQYSATLLSDDSIYSNFWTFIAGEVYLWEKCSSTLLFVWLSCLFVFLTVALILSTQMYQTYRKKEELERHRIEMANALAHDLKTPLSIISGYAENLMANIHAEKRERYAAQILDKVSLMDRIIREMLDLSRLESTDPALRYQHLSLHGICQEIVDRYRDVCHERSILVQLEGEQTLSADAALIKRVIENFFVNALEHTPDGGTIRMTISGNTFEIHNSGSHIPEDKLKSIWQPYYKADEARSRTQGTGLGLAIAGKILEAHRFSYGAKNCDDGVAFWFKFA